MCMMIGLDYIIVHVVDVYDGWVGLYRQCTNKLDLRVEVKIEVAKF